MSDRVGEKEPAQCTCKALHGDNRECPWHGIEAMREYHDQQRRRHS